MTQPGQWKNYHYPNFQDARTLWSHDHGDHHTAENAYMGLAAPYQCSDAGANPTGIELPEIYGGNEYPLRIADKAY